jgi:hypothetical protein
MFELKDVAQTGNTLLRPPKRRPGRKINGSRPIPPKAGSPTSAYGPEESAFNGSWKPGILRKSKSGILAPSADSKRIDRRPRNVRFWPLADLMERRALRQLLTLSGRDPIVRLKSAREPKRKTRLFGSRRQSPVLS